MKFYFKKSRGHSFTVTKDGNTGFIFSNPQMNKTDLIILKRYVRKISKDAEIIYTETVDEDLMTLLKHYGFSGTTYKYCKNYECKLKLKNKEDWAFFTLLSIDGIEI